MTRALLGSFWWGDVENVEGGKRRRRSEKVLMRSFEGLRKERRPAGGRKGQSDMITGVFLSPRDAN